MNRAADRLPNAANTFWAIPFLHTVSSAVNGNITNIELNIQRKGLNRLSMNTRQPAVTHFHESCKG